MALFYARFTLVSAVWLLTLLPAAAIAQEPPPHLSVVEGSVQLERQGDVQPAVANMPLVPGDRIATLEGRAEILFPDGSALDLDANSSIELVTPIRLSLTAGRAIFVVPGDVSRQYATRYEIDTPVSTIVTGGFGTYRADARSDAAVWPADAFDEWAEARYGERNALGSSQYLPQDLRVYSNALDRYGSWQYDTSYGYVWYPGVGSAWHPYYNGFWEPLPRYGWTWIGVDRWAWPTHHYGRWGYSRSRWFWIPGRTFGPAWVSWGAADGLVSWCPLGFDNRPVFALSYGTGFPSGGWVVVPRTAFGARGSFVNRYALAPQHVGPHTAFIASNVPPVAVPRDTGRRTAADVRVSRGRLAPAISEPSRSNIGPVRSAPFGTAVPRAGIASRTTVPAVQTRTPTPQQPLITEPQRSVPGIVRRPDSWERPGIRTPQSRITVPGSVPDRRQGPVAVPRALPPVPAAPPRADIAAAPPANAGHSRAPLPMYGGSRAALPGPVPAPVPAAPRSASPVGVAPVVAPRPVSPGPFAVPRAMQAPPSAAPSAAPTPPPAPPAAAYPSRPAPSRSGGESHTSGGQAQGRRRN